MLLNVSDIRQWSYCQRVVYYRYYGPAFRPTTFKMEEGRAEHVRTEQLEHRRALRTYGLKEGERAFNVGLRSDELGLSGRLDMAIVVPEAVLPVEFKHTTGGVAENHRLQLAAYGLLAEQQWQRPAHGGFVYLIPARRAVSVGFDEELRNRVHASIVQIRQMLDQQAFPPQPRVRGRCRDCEYRRFCNDVE